MTHAESTYLTGTDYAHQAEAYEKAKDMDDFGFLMEAGTGKTRPTLKNALYLFDKGKIDTLLIEAPNNVHRKWVNEEIPKHFAPGIPYKAAFYRAGAGIRESAEFDEAIKYRSGLRILAYNIESLSLDAGKRHALAALAKRAAMVALDESSRIKTPSSKRTKNAHALGDIANYRRILTGTPVSQGLHDLYSQFRFLNWKIIGTRTFTEFKSRYCQMGGYDEREIVGYLNEEELLSKIAPYVFEANKKDCLDLPEEMWQTREVELSAEQKRHYRDLRDTFVAELKSNRLEVPLAGVRMLRLRQLLSGFFPTPDNGVGTYENLPCPRLDSCADLVEEAARGKIIVWCHFRPDVINMMAKLKERGITCVPYDGSINDDQRQRNLDNWKTQDKIVALVATPATGGIGLDMVEADTDVTYSHNYNYEEYTQKNARNHRSGQWRPVTHYELVARGTADVRMMKRVRDKGDVADMVKNLKRFEVRKELIEMFQEAA